MLDRLVSGGPTHDKALAAHFGVSVFTAKNHVISIVGKLGVTNRTQAAVYGLTGVRPPWEFEIVDSAEKIV